MATATIPVTSVPAATISFAAPSDLTMEALLVAIMALLAVASFCAGFFAA